MDPLTLIGAGSSIAGLVGGLFGKKKKTEPQVIDSRTPEQKAVSAKLAQILTQGGAKYTGDRVAGMSGGEDYVQTALMKALQTAQPGIDRQLKGEMPEEYFNMAVADPARRQFKERMLPIMRENSTVTGNRFADRSAIAIGQAAGDVEAGITQQRGQLALDTYRDPLNAASTLTNVLAQAENIFAVPRTIQQAKLDADFQEFMRTNPDAGGLIDAMMNFTGQAQTSAFMPQQQQSIFPSLIQAGGSLIGNAAMINALKGPSVPVRDSDF